MRQQKEAKPMRQQKKQSRGRSADKSPPRAIRNAEQPTAEELQRRSAKFGTTLPRRIGLGSPVLFRVHS